MFDAQAQSTPRSMISQAIADCLQDEQSADCNAEVSSLKELFLTLRRQLKVF